MGGQEFKNRRLGYHFLFTPPSAMIYYGTWRETEDRVDVDYKQLVAQLAVVLIAVAGGFLYLSGIEIKPPKSEGDDDSEQPKPTDPSLSGRSVGLQCPKCTESMTLYESQIGLDVECPTPECSFTFTVKEFLFHFATATCPDCGKSVTVIKDQVFDTIECQNPECRCKFIVPNDIFRELN